MERRKRIVLDTHIWVKWLLNEKLPQNILNVLKREDMEKCLASFSLWEIAMLSSKKRLKLLPDCLTWISRGLEQSQITLLPLSPVVAVLSCHLPGTFHSDPGDRIIVASALQEKATLLTEDKAIKKYARQKHIKVL